MVGARCVLGFERGVVAVAGHHPYRAKPVALAPDLAGPGRKLAAHGVSIVLVCLLCRLPLLVLFPHGVAALEAVLVVGTWLFTSRCDGDGSLTRKLAWALRVLSIVEAVSMVARLFETPVSSDASRYSYPLFAMLVVPAAGMLFLAARLHGFGLSRTARRVWWVLSSWVLGWLLVPLAWRVWELVTLYFYVGLPLYLCSWIWAFFVMLRLRRTLKVELQEWWLDLEARPRVEWTSYALLGDLRVELVGPDGEASFFANHADASFWLTQRGFCPRDRVMRDRLIPEGAIVRAQIETG